MPGADGVLSARIDGAMHRFRRLVAATTWGARRRQRSLARRRCIVGRTRRGGGRPRIRAPMPGRVVLVQASPGTRVKAREVLLVIEAMKMELALKPRDGIVAEVRGRGRIVEADAVLATLEA